MPGSLLGITYAEFDNHVGPQLKFSYPTDVLTHELFEAYSDYVIVSKQLCEKAIAVTIDEQTFINYSVAIDNTKYFRNTLIFSFGFVVVKNIDTEPYESALRKISSTFVNLETETEYLFQAESNLRLQDFLKTLYNDLNNKNEACIKLDALDNYLAVKLYRSPTHSVSIQDYDVPMLNNTHGMDLSNLPWDISFQHLIPFIDGKSHVKKIVKQIDMDGDFVRRSLNLLLFHNFIILSDIFRFSNVYALTSTEHAINMLSDSMVLGELRDFCAIEVCGIVATLPSNNQLINFLLGMQQNKSVQQVILDLVDSNATTTNRGSSGGLHGLDSLLPNHQPSPVDDSFNPRLLPLKNMDVSRVIAYACSKHILRRVHEYPVYCAPSTGIESTPSDPLPATIEDTVQHNTLQNSRSSLFLAGTAAPTTQDKRVFASLHGSGRRLSFGGSSSSSSGGVEEHKTSSLSRDDITSDLRASRNTLNSAVNSSISSRPLAIGIKVLPLETPPPATEPGASGSYVVGNEIMMTDVSSPPTTAFHKLSRTRSVVGRSYLNPNHSPVDSSSLSSLPPTAVQQGGVQGSAVGTGRVTCLADITTSLTGKHKLDEICSKYSINYRDIVDFPGVKIVYKW